MNKCHRIFHKACKAAEREGSWRRAMNTVPQRIEFWRRAWEKAMKKYCKDIHTA